jgi:hypothetical protein
VLIACVPENTQLCVPIPISFVIRYGIRIHSQLYYNVILFDFTDASFNLKQCNIYGTVRLYNT